MTYKILLYYSEAIRINRHKKNEHDKYTFCTFVHYELFDIKIIQFISEKLSDIISGCFDKVTFDSEPIKAKNEENYDHHIGVTLVIETKTPDEISERLWGILIMLFNEVLEIKQPEKYTPLYINSLDIHNHYKEVILDYIPNIFNKKPIGTKLINPIKIELVEHNEILEVIGPWGTNQPPIQPIWEGEVTLKGKLKTLSFNQSISISSKESRNIKVYYKNDEYFEILNLAIEYQKKVFSDTKDQNTIIEITANKWFNPLDRKSEYRYIKAEVVTIYPCKDEDNNTLQLDF